MALIALVAIASCSIRSGDQREPRLGTWRVELELLDRTLPFEWVLQRSDSAWVARIRNAAEEIVIRDVRFHADSFMLRMPLFDSEFKGILVNDSTIEGFWHHRLKGPDHRIPFKAMAGVEQRFPGQHDGRGAFAGKWETHFSKGTKDAYGAIGLFDQHPGGHITGTFITETGDYRFLEGVVHQDSMQLSSFDGSHAFLFAARLHADSMVGRFWSGDHWQEPWVAYRNTSYELRHPDSLTFMREGHTVADFKFPDLEGDPVSPHDERFRGKVLVLQVMGSWCANCVDETVALKSFYDTYAERGLEVIAIAFEKYADPQKAIDGLKRFRKELGVKYPIVYAGMASKQQAAEKLPFLNHILSYPTCVFIGRNGQVRRIRTGFYGPSTGQHHVAYINELRAFIERLLAEPVPVSYPSRPE